VRPLAGSASEHEWERGGAGTGWPQGGPPPPGGQEAARPTVEEPAGLDTPTEEPAGEMRRGVRKKVGGAHMG
jgi:hypothetical protein